MTRHSSSRRLAVELLVIATVLTSIVAPGRLRAQVYSGWPTRLASRAPALADSLARSFGQRPDTIRFGGTDTLHVFFRDPRFWHDDVTSRVLPENSLPAARKAALDVAEVAWGMVGREANVIWIRVAFVRVIRERTDRNPIPREVLTHAVSGMVSPAMIDARQEPGLGITLREGGQWGPTALLAGRATAPQFGLAAPDMFAIGRAALADSIENELGKHMCKVAVKGRDTIDVLIPNPRFWWKDDTLKALPESSLPEARAMAKRAAVFIWDRHAQVPGINVIRVRFSRDYKTLTNGMMLQRPAQEVSTQFTRQQLATGQLDPVQLTVVQR